jgi:hypothetical protein
VAGVVADAEMKHVVHRSGVRERFPGMCLPPSFNRTPDPLVTSVALQEAPKTMQGAILAR